MSARSILLASVATLTLAGGAQAAPAFSALYAFGDSLSDAGNLFALSSNPAFGIAQQPLPPYSAGRFTNGNTWVQDLSMALGNGPLTASLAGGNDFAYGGARTGSTALGPATFIDLPSQLTQFAAVHGSAPANALYTISIGSNDIFDAIAAVAHGMLTTAQAQATISMAAQNTADFAHALQALGARQLLLYDVPDLALTPAFHVFGALATGLALEFNTMVTADLATVEASGLSVHVLGEFAHLEAVVADPAAFGFTNATDPCWTGGFQGPTSGATLCAPTAAGQDKYLFWDGVHPTEAAHLLVANDALAALPEPTSLVLLAGGMLGLALVRRRAD